MDEIFENDSEWSKKHIKHDNRYGYIDCPYCGCHHYMDNYIDDDFEFDDCFTMACDNCRKDFEVRWKAENKVLHTFYANT